MKRRYFLTRSALGLVGVAVGRRATAKAAPDADQPGAAKPAEATAPPAFGTAPSTGPEVSAATFAEAEKLAQVAMSPRSARRRPRTGAPRWRRCSSGDRAAQGRARSRRTRRRCCGTPPRGRRKVPPPGAGATASCAARRRAAAAGARRGPGVRAGDVAVALDRVAQAELRAADHDLPRAARAVPAEALCSITITRDHALAAARAPTPSLRTATIAGRCTACPGAPRISSTPPASPRRGAPRRSPPRAGDATRPWCDRLADAGAVLVAKLSLGALALNDVWFGGQTKNPWCLDEGSSGWSAGPGGGHGRGPVRLRHRLGDARQHRLAVDALRSPGLRPTFGRVSRTGAMACAGRSTSWGRWPAASRTRCWSPRAPGADAADPRGAVRRSFDANRPVRGLRVGYFPAWMSRRRRRRSISPRSSTARAGLAPSSCRCPIGPSIAPAHPLRRGGGLVRGADASHGVDG